MTTRFILDDDLIETDENDSKVLLDFIRETGLKGTKIGCREGDCGACTVVVGELKGGEVQYHTCTSCLTSLKKVKNTHVVTIEGLGEAPTQIQLSMHDEGATQCGFCTPGFVMSLTSSSLNNADAIKHLDGNICRCTGYKSIERAARKTQEIYEPLEGELSRLIEKGFIPSYFITIKQRLEELQNSDQGTEKGRLVGGGTDLYVQKRRELERNQIREVPEKYRYIRQEADSIKIGAATRMTDILEDSQLSEFLGKDKLRMIASTQIRNMATLAGNIVNASPIGDFSIIFLALEADLKILGEKGERRVKLEDFYRGYKDIDLLEEETITEISIPWTWNLFNFEKVSKRKMLDIASVNSCIALSGDAENIGRVRVSAGGIYAYPLYLKETSEYLSGKEVSTGLIREALDLLQNEIKPISDVRGSKEYKAMLLRNLLIIHFQELFPASIDLEVLLK